MRSSLPYLSLDFASVPLVVWWKTAFGIFCYIASIILWFYILSKNTLSFAYPVAIGLTLIITGFGAWFILKETISLIQIVGYVFMIIAIFLISARSI